MRNFPKNQLWFCWSQRLSFHGSWILDPSWWAAFSVFLNILTLTSSQKLTSAIVAPTTRSEKRNEEDEKRRDGGGEREKLKERESERETKREKEKEWEWEKEWETEREKWNAMSFKAYQRWEVVDYFHGKGREWQSAGIIITTKQYNRINSIIIWSNLTCSRIDRSAELFVNMSETIISLQE